MDEPIEDVYFNWLYSKVASVEVPTPSLTHWNLLRELHATEFVWLISGDDNRAADGVALRREFHRMIQLELDQELPWMMLGCSVLEMLIGFSRRASFQTDMPEREWFWIFLGNLRLADLNDAQEDFYIYVREVLDSFIWRTYRRNGDGGLFPLKAPKKNQKKVEIWYQFCEYLEQEEYF